ncbi:MAG TPA: LytTR family DNA-binding domain-containing protein [Bryobacteraceae bacterium]|jgi:DNA-binding LytR/AlgR family response regulator|nr:LytTR family DNA-binding domain-containing protein [Bryobacteraceae bacterium]
MRSLIVDDEADARTRLARLLKDHPEIVIAGEAEDGLEALEKIEKLQPDLLFLDIEMPGLTGFELLQSVPAKVPMPLVIFVTGYDQHALAAFEANALAYLLKPVERDRLAQAVTRARQLYAFDDDKKAEQKNILRVAREAPKVLRRLVCRARDRLVLLPVEQILWFQVESGIVKAKSASELFWVNFQLADLEATLPQDLFFRARRDVLVNLARIKEIRPYFKSGFLLVMSDPAATEFVVSERQVRPFRQRMPGL